MSTYDAPSMLNNGATLCNILKVMYIKISMMLNALTDYMCVNFISLSIIFALFQWRKHGDKPSPNGKIILLQYLRGIIIKYEYKILSKSKIKVLLSIIYSFFAR